jgi:RHS repeat-associated protein
MLIVFFKLRTWFSKISRSGIFHCSHSIRFQKNDARHRNHLQRPRTQRHLRFQLHLRPQSKNKVGISVISSYDCWVNVISQRTRVAPSDHAYQRGIIGNRQKSVNSLTFPVANNYTENSLNQYSAINNPQSSVINHSYDLDGTATTTYKYDAWNCLAEYERGTGVSPVLTLKKTRLWGTDLSGTPQGAGGVAGLLSESIISNPQSQIYYPLYDGNGNISEYLTATGTTAAHFEYDPFGNTVVNTDTANLFTYRFSTKPRDQETGLYYYGYRYYDPMTGRWPSRDPIEEMGGNNLFGMVGNAVVNKWDILGLKNWCCSYCGNNKTVKVYIGDINSDDANDVGNKCTSANPDSSKYQFTSATDVNGSGDCK